VQLNHWLEGLTLGGSAWTATEQGSVDRHGSDGPKDHRSLAMQDVGNGGQWSVMLIDTIRQAGGSLLNADANFSRPYSNIADKYSP
jgi:hypothetical protein